jgi:hypothetical protein
MAIDMIENNDLGTFTEGRLGFRQFADEKFSNYTGGEDFYNLFGSRKAKKSAFREAVRQKYQNLPSDCERVQNSIDLISNDVQTLLKQKSSLEVREKLDESNIILGEYKRLQIQQNCEGLAAQKAKQEERESTLATLTQLTESSVGQAKTELTTAKSAVAGIPTKNLLIYGGVGVAAFILIALILKKKS